MCARLQSRSFAFITAGTPSFRSLRTNTTRGDVMTKLLTRTIATCAMAVVGLALAGCAAGSGTDSPSESSALTPVKVVIAPIMTEPFYYGVDSGIFEEHGLDVSLVPGGFLPAQQVPVLLSGEGNIAMSGGITLIAGVVEGLPIQAIHPILTSSDQVEPDSGVIVAPGSTLEDWEDLEGGTIAIPGLNEMPQLAIMYAVEEAGGDPTTIEFLEMPITNMNDAVQKGQVDAALQISTFYSQAVGQGFGTFGDPAAQYFSGAPTIQLMATTDWIAENEETIDKFNAALDEIMTYLNDHPDAIRDVQREYTELPDEVIDMAIVPTYFTEFDRTGYERVLEYAAEYGFLSEQPDFGDIVWSGAPIE